MKTILALFLMMAAPLVWAQESLDISGRHVFFLHPGVDEIKGSYLFLVNNGSSKPQAQAVRLMLPAETFDWMPQEGIQPDELKPGKDGGLVLEKTFPPGETMLSLGFRTSAAGGEATLTFQPEFAVGSLALFARSGTLGLGPSRDGWQYSENTQFSNRPYDTMTRGFIKPGEKVAITLTRVPEGRRRLWLVGFVAGALFFLSGGILAWRTRPSKRQLDEVESAA